MECYEEPKKRLVIANYFTCRGFRRHCHFNSRLDNYSRIISIVLNKKGFVNLSRLILIFVCVICFIILGYGIKNFENFRYEDVYDLFLFDKTGLIAFYVLPALIGLSCLWALRFTASTRKTILIHGATIVVAIYAAEIYLSLQAPAPRGKILVDAAKSGGRAFDPRSRTEYVLDLRKKGINAYPYAGRGELLEHGTWKNGRLISPIKVNGKQVVPLAGISGKTTVLCNEPGTWLTYKADRYGFNNPDSIWDLKNIQVALIGDSLPHGYCLPDESHATPRFRATFPRTANLGFAGSGALEYLGTLMEYASLIRPKIVIWIHYENDVRDMELEKSSDVLLKYLNKGLYRQKIPERQTEVDSATMKFIDDFMEKHGTGLLGERRVGAPILAKMQQHVPKYKDAIFLRNIRNTFKIYFRKEDSDLELFRKTMTKAAEVVQSWGGKLYFVFRPYGDRGSDPFVVRRQYDYERKQVLSIVESIGMPVIDLLPVFKKKLPPMWTLYPGSHYTKAGNFLFADTIINRLAGDGVVPQP